MEKQTVPRNVASLEDLLNEYFGKKAPQLPANIKEAIVKYSPWITLVVLLLSLPAVLVIFGLGTVMSPFMYLGGLRAGTQFTLSLLVLAVTIVLEAMAISGLMKRSKKGWNLIFYATLVGAVSSVLSFNFGGLIIGTALSFYLLFQVRSYYK